MTYEDTLTALAEPTRRHIFEHLRARPQTVGELAQTQPVSRPAVSQHLKILQAAHLVRVTPIGNRRVYEIDRTGIEALRRYLDGFWDDVLSAYKTEITLRGNTERKE